MVNVILDGNEVIINNNRMSINEARELKDKLIIVIKNYDESHLNEAIDKPVEYKLFDEHEKQKPQAEFKEKPELYY